MEEGPPRKKRRSKWDMKAPEMSSIPAATTSHSNPPLLANPTDSAVAAAAKINAMLAAQGKLKSDAPPLVSTLPKKTSPHTLISAAPLTPGGGLLLLTKPAALLASPSTPPLYASVPGGQHYIQDKVFVGLEQAPEGFDVKEKLEGPNGSYLLHIATQSGAKVFLRGRGSGFIEPTSGKESFEALHVYISHPTQAGLMSARKLCESLIETVKKDYEMFKASQSAPLGFGSAPGYGPPPAHHIPYINPYQQAGVVGPPPPPQGYGPPPPQHYGGGIPPYQTQPPHVPPPAVPAYPYYPPAPPPGYIPPQPQGGGPPIGFYAPPPPVGEQYGGSAPPPGPPHPPHHHSPPPTNTYTPDDFSYKPHDRTPGPAPKRSFSEQIGAPLSTGDQEYFSFSNGKNAGSITSTVGGVIEGGGRGMISQSQAPAMDPDKGRNQPHSETQSVPSSKPTRRFKEAEMIADSKPATSSLISKPDSLDEKSEFEPQHSGTTNDHTHQPTLTSTKTQVVTNEHRSNHGDSEVMKPPSLPPPSKIKDAKIMPPPSLPGRKVKVPDKSSPNPPVVTPPTSNATTASEKAPPTSGALSLVAYGDESDSDTDT